MGTEIPRVMNNASIPSFPSSRLPLVARDSARQDRVDTIREDGTSRRDDVPFEEERKIDDYEQTSDNPASLISRARCT